MHSLSMNKYKDSDPLTTIHKIRTILYDLGINTTELNWQNSANGFFSVTISVSGTSIRTNGKGTTKEFALASVYGELMERLQNFAPFRLSMDFSNNVLEYGGFYYAPDEKMYDTNDLLSSNNEWLQCQLATLNNSHPELISLFTKWKKVSYEDIPKDFITIPYKNISTSNISYIPIKMSNKMYMSNGMCAGNTREEALIQGLCELMERYANKQIIENKITPPTIPRKYINNYSGISSMINELEFNGNYKVIIKDCSLGKGFPVTCVILINAKTSEYFIKFGAYPIFEISVERTLTELLQGQNIYKMKGLKDFYVTPPVEDASNNVMGILVNGSGYYPKEIFMDTPTYEWIGFNDLNGNSNLEILNKLISFIEHQGYKILVRDVSFLEFPAYHIIIPNYSEIEKIDDNESIDNFILYNNIKRLTRNIRNLTSVDIIKLIDYINNAKFHPLARITTMLNIEVKKGLPWYYKNISLLLVALYLKIDDYKNAYKVFNNYIETIKSSGKININNYYKCIRNYLDLRSQNKSVYEINSLLNNFFPNYLVNKVEKEINTTTHLFKGTYILECFNCEKCEVKSSCIHIGNEMLLIKLKDKYK